MNNTVFSSFQVKFSLSRTTKAKEREENS